MKMKCKLPAVNVKLFAKAIHCLAKLGNEIFIEPLETGLAIKTVNSSRSAYASFLFLRSLFQTYEHQLADQNQVEAFKCKVAVKTLLQVFKSISNIEKSVESCDIDLDEDECRLVFQLKCRHGIVKTHQLTFQECESLQAVFAKDLSPNVLKCEHKLLNDVVVNFPFALEEVTLGVSPCQVSFKSYVDGDDPHTSLLKTAMTLNPEEFIDFQVGVDTDVTFSLKDLRAVLSFCDAACVPVYFHFETGGKPLVISVEQDDSFKTNFVLATISDEELFSQQKNASSYANKNKTKKAAQTNGDPNHKVLPKSQISSASDKQQPSVNRMNQKRLNDSAVDVSNLPPTNDEQLSPEIPVQNFRSTTNNESVQVEQYKKIKKVFFEPTQGSDDHSMVVLAPDSDGEGT